MYFRKMLALLLVLLSLFAISCSDGDEGVVLSRYDDNGFQYSPTGLQGLVEYALPLVPEFVRVERLDDSFRSMDSIEVEINPNIKTAFAFRAFERDYKNPYVKIVAVFLNGNEKVEFPQYVRLTENNGNLKLNLNEALAAGRIDYLMQKENLDFAVAEEKAYSEMTQLFGLDFNALHANRYNGVHYANKWEMYKPYLYCRHEISDSLFYSDYKELYDSFSKTGRIDSSMIVRAADAWLATFENTIGENGKPTFKSLSRNTFWNEYKYWHDFFQKSYGIKFSMCDTCQAVIEKKSSDFYGRRFVCEFEKWGGANSYIRLSTLFEDSIGACLLSKTALVEHNGLNYLCKKEENVWNVENNRDTILTYKFGTCGSYATKNHAFYMHDSLFYCECLDEINCAWTDKYVKTDFNEKDSLYAEVLHAKAVDQFGECKGDGDKRQLDSVFVQCSFGRWVQIDSLLYYLGGCTKDNQKGEHLGLYYSCIEYWQGADSPVWREVYPPVYFNDTCDSRFQNHVVKYDSTYFICEAEYCIEEDGFVKFGCWGIGHWRKIKDDEMIPPMIDNIPCERDRINLRIGYGDDFFICRDGRWYPVVADSVMPPEKDGLFCTDSLYGLVKRYGGTYYMCDSVRWWREMPALEAGPYAFRDSLGKCNSNLQKTIYWSEKADAFFGCTKIDSVLDWREIRLGKEPYTMPESFKKEKFKGGTFTDDSVYSVTVDNNLYRFILSKNTMYLSHVDLASGGYDAYFYNKNLFLHRERSKERLSLDSLDNKSESFETFYETWKVDVKKYSECNRRSANVETVSLLDFDETAYMDWASAMSFCPEGFHIPSIEEFKQEDYISYLTTDLMLRNDSPVLWYFKMHTSGCYENNNVYFDVFWSATEKNSKTQECFEIAWRDRGELGRRVVDCPKDLYPMVQTLCVKDK